MPYLNKQSIIQHAISQGFTANMTKSEVMQHKKEPTKKEPARPPRLNPLVGRYKAPPKSFNKEIELSSHQLEERKFTEYRSGLIKKLTEVTAKSTLPDENKQKNFIEAVRTSKDICALLFDTALINRLDKLGGMPKLVLTVYCKWIESYI